MASTHAVTANAEADNKPNIAPHDGEQDRAARVLQSRYRVYSEKKKRGLDLGSAARWNDAIKTQQMRQNHRESNEGHNDPATRWQRGGYYAGRLANDDGAGRAVEGKDTIEEPDKDGKHEQKKKGPENERSLMKLMEEKYYLEMVDEKHRYAANLKYYHAVWDKEYKGNQNFFQWLDHGDGKDLDIPDQCPRKRLDSERILYLNAEQRLNYLVKIKDGKLVWARNDIPVDTARGRHKDLPNGHGIVDCSTQELLELKKNGDPPESDDSSLSSSSSSSDGDSAIDESAQHYNVDRPAVPRTFGGRVKDAFNPALIMDHLLRKTLNQNTWIWVCDVRFNVYVGIKQTGRFQHSSFLYGSKVIGAGLLKVNKGQLRSLSPLSGHYRSGTIHFKNFVRRLEDADCDMSRVSISKSLITIGLLEKYGRFNKANKAVAAKFHDGLHSATSPTFHHRKPELSGEEKLNRKVENGATAKSPGLIAQIAGENQRQLIKKAAGGPIPRSRLPFEGKKLEELTEHQRIERGAAIIARVMASGLKKKETENGDGTCNQELGKQISRVSTMSLISPDQDQAASQELSKSTTSNDKTVIEEEHDVEAPEGNIQQRATDRGVI